MPKHVIVIGAGIIGAAIAYHLAKDGARVSVLDAGEPGGLATRKSWAWINASWGNPEPYFRLRMRSMAEWQRLAGEVPGLGLDWCGGLTWEATEAELEAFAAERAAWGHPIRRVSRAEILAIEPNLRNVPEHGYHVADEGKVEPLAAARALLGAARERGATLLGQTPVKWLAEERGRVAGVMTDDGVIHADEVVVAAGAHAADLLDSLGITLRMTSPAGLLSHSKPTKRLLSGIAMTPGLHLRQTEEGRIVVGTDFTSSDLEVDADQLAADLHAKACAMVSGAEGLALDFYTVGYRPTPADGFPAIGRPDRKNGLYLVVTHSGVTLAAALGLFAAQELLTGTRDPLLATFSPDRPGLS